MVTLSTVDSLFKAVTLFIVVKLFIVVTSSIVVMWSTNGTLFLVGVILCSQIGDALIVWIYESVMSTHRPLG